MQRNRGKQQNEKSRDSSKKLRNTKGTFHGKMDTIKDRSGMDLTEAEDIRRGGKNTQKNYLKKIFMTQKITMCEVSGALGTINTNKASGGNGFTVELQQILTDDAVKLLHSICQ